MSARTAVALFVTFLMGLAAGTALCYKSLMEAHGIATQAQDISIEAVHVTELWRTRVDELDTSLQRCVELQAHRAGRRPIPPDIAVFDR